MPETPKKTTPKKKLGVYVQLTAAQRSALDDIGKKELFKSDGAGDVLRIYLNKHWDDVVGKSVPEDDEPQLFPEN